MRVIAYKLFSYFASHPLITAISVLLLFTLPIFHMLVFFWPLIVSTALGVLAVLSVGCQSEKDSTPIAGCATAESAWQQDIDGSSSQEEKISNVLMVGNQEVTWLEWLHNEDARKLICCESAVWDADGSTMAREATVVDPASMATIDSSMSSMYEEEAPLQANDEGKLCAGDSRDERKTHVSALVLTEEIERVSSTVLDGSRGTATGLEVVNEEEMKINTPILRAVDEKNLDSTGEDHMCRFGRTAQNSIAFTVDGESNTHAPTCADGDEGQMSVEGLCLTDGCGNASKAMQGLCHSAMPTKNEVNGYTSAHGDKIACIPEAVIESNPLVHSACDIEGTLNKCVLEGETGHLVAVSRLEGTFEAIPYASEPKIVPAHDLDALDLAFSNKMISPLLQMKGAGMHGTRHVDKQDDMGRGSNQFETQGPRWDVSDGEEERSSLRFSFFHSS